MIILPKFELILVFKHNDVFGDQGKIGRICNLFFKIIPAELCSRLIQGKEITQMKYELKSRFMVVIHFWYDFSHEVFYTYGHSVTGHLHTVQNLVFYVYICSPSQDRLLLSLAN